jgi:tetratricopeptide (TPR) repeat protein
MRRLLVALCLLAATLWSAPAFAQARSQLGPLCTTDTTPADQMIDACSKIIALKVFKGEQLATVYFWRAVGWNKKGDYAKVITDATEAIRLQPNQAAYNLRGSAYCDRGEYEIAITDFDDALKLGPPSGTIFHNRGNAWRGKGDYAKAIADTTCRSRPIQNRHSRARTAASPGRRSAISTARSPISTRRSGSTRRCRCR